MTLQEIFDEVVKKVVAQGEPSVVPTPGAARPFQCRYRGDEGRKCAVGHLIPDEKYDPVMEHQITINVLKQIGIIGHKKQELLVALQAAHDNAAEGGVHPRKGSDFVEAFKRRARETASLYNLDRSAAA